MPGDAEQNIFLHDEDHYHRHDGFLFGMTCFTKNYPVNNNVRKTMMTIAIIFNTIPAFIISANRI